MYSRYNRKSRAHLVRNMVLDRESLETLGVHNNNINLFIKGRYVIEERMGKSRCLSVWNLISVLILGGSIFALIMALDGWVYGYILFGLGLVISLLSFFSTVMTRKVKREDPLNIKTTECVNYAILKSIEFFTEQFSLVGLEDDENYIEEAFHQLHSIGIEKEFDEIKEIVEGYSLDDPKEEIMADYLKGILNPLVPL